MLCFPSAGKECASRLLCDDQPSLGRLGEKRRQIPPPSRRPAGQLSGDHFCSRPGAPGPDEMLGPDLQTGVKTCLGTSHQTGMVGVLAVSVPPLFVHPPALSSIEASLSDHDEEQLVVSGHRQRSTLDNETRSGGWPSCSDRRNLRAENGCAGWDVRPRQHRSCSRCAVHSPLDGAFASRCPECRGRDQVEIVHVQLRPAFAV